MECPQVERIQEGLGGWTVRDRLVNTLAGPASAVFIGGAFALQILVAGACLPRINLTETQVQLYVTLVSLGWGIAGAWCPQQLVAGFLKRIWSHIRSHEYSQDDLMLLRPRATSDFVLRWLFIGGLASAIGVSQLLIIGLCWPLQSISTFLATEFLWMPITWTATQLALVALILFVPSVMLGMVVAGLGAASTTDGRQELRGPIPLLCAGVVLAIVFWSQMDAAWAGRWLGFLLVSVPLFAASVLAVLQASTSERLQAAIVSDTIHPPERVSRDRFLIAAGLFTWAPLMALWTMSGSTPSDTGVRSLLTRQGVLLGTLLAGVVVGDWQMSRRKHSRGGAGVALWALGLASMVGGTIAHLLAGSTPGSDLSKGTSLAFVSGGLLAAGTMGYTLPYLVRCLVRRYPSPAFGYSVAVTCLFAGGLVGAILTRSTIAAALDARHMMVLLSLGAIAAGGGLVIYEPESSGRRRSVRLGLVFGSLGLLIFLFGCLSAR